MSPGLSEQAGIQAWHDSNALFPSQKQFCTAVASVAQTANTFAPALFALPSTSVQVENGSTTPGWQLPSAQCPASQAPQG